MIQSISRSVAGAVGVALLVFATMALFGDPVSAATPSPSTAETARLLGYMWGDGDFEAGVWDVNGPSGTSSLIEQLVEEHGGEWTNRQKLQFRLPAPYDWTGWKDGLPDDSAEVRAAVQNPHFLAALMETEASVVGQIYDQSRCCVPGYTRGRLTALRDLMRSQGFSTTTFVEFNNADSGKITVDAAEWSELRARHRFVCPAEESDIRLPGGTDYDRHGDIRWFNADTRWSDLVRTDCVPGAPIPPAPPHLGSCTVSSLNAGEVRVEWTFTRGEASIRRNGSFLDSASARVGSFTDTPGNGTFGYEVRLQSLGAQTDATCGSVTVGADVDAPCVVSASPAGVEVSWDDFDRQRYSVRRNGSWVGTVTDGSTTFVSTEGVVTDTWTVRYRTDGRTITVGCVSGQPPANGPCVVTAIGGGVAIDWDDIAGDPTYHVRRNGKWLATVAGQSRYDHTGGTLGASYAVRYRQNGAVIDIACTA